MKHPLPLLITCLFLFIFGTSMLRNKTCPCGMPADMTDISPSKAATAVAAVAPTAVNYVETKAVETVATPSVFVDEGRVKAIEKRLRAKELVLYFDYDQPNTSLSDAQRKDLEDIQYYIAQNPESNISVVGHTDSKGTAAYNAQLSTARANFVTDYLTGQGANAQKFVTQGKGESAPASTNKTMTGRAKNRRVVISLS